MNKIHSPIITTLLIFLFIIQENCISAEHTDDRHRHNLYSHIENHTPFLQTPSNTSHVDNHLPAIEQINHQLFTNFGSINPTIRLDPSTHAEISHLSARYESFPTNVSYDHDNNQVTLTWHTSTFGMPQAKVKAFNLAKRFNTESISPSMIATQTIQKPVINPPSQPFLNRHNRATPATRFNNSRVVPVISFPRFPNTIRQAENAFYNTYRQYPDICSNFTPEPKAYQNIVQDFFRHGNPIRLDIALDDRGKHILILEWNDNTRFHYRLDWVRK